ncbi:MAG: RrF2 family transcriptional regulator [Deltaproteobacteria bacterium]|nr:RrF2 family transcriptional regulator [Deltaproteobacteria bacterium]MBW2018094.1 RrF2 family transcriptional regulator [Deltaproteobacteria bacterium]MBW2129965.1 RrF2 family transcriptional regulator [Deltaproteobacteria bacterium]MBW2304250.1 RrF2 family transcriptional regulator [Deltaproteobacteria bacterium]
MKLSTRGRYGTRLMLELTKNYGKGPVSTSQISRNQNIPIKYLEQLIIPLKKAGLINSVRGPKGGHMLSREPEEITLWDILTLLENRMTFVDCVDGEKVCPNASNCLVRPIWEKAFAAALRIFKETTLSDILHLQGEELEQLSPPLPGNDHCEGPKDS